MVTFGTVFFFSFCYFSFLMRTRHSTPSKLSMFRILQQTAFVSYWLYNNLIPLIYCIDCMLFLLWEEIKIQILDINFIIIITSITYVIG